MLETRLTSTKFVSLLFKFVLHCHRSKPPRKIICESAKRSLPRQRSRPNFVTFYVLRFSLFTSTAPTNIFFDCRSQHPSQSLALAVRSDAGPPQSQSRPRNLFTSLVPRTGGIVVMSAPISVYAVLLFVPRRFEKLRIIATAKLKVQMQRAKDVNKQ